MALRKGFYSHRASDSFPSLPGLCKGGDHSSGGQGTDARVCSPTPQQTAAQSAAAVAAATQTPRHPRLRELQRPNQRRGPILRNLLTRALWLRIGRRDPPAVAQRVGLHAAPRRPEEDRLRIVVLRVAAPHLPAHDRAEVLGEDELVLPRRVAGGRGRRVPRDQPPERARRRVEARLLERLLGREFAAVVQGPVARGRGVGDVAVGLRVEVVAGEPPRVDLDEHGAEDRGDVRRGEGRARVVPDRVDADRPAAHRAQPAGRGYRVGLHGLHDAGPAEGVPAGGVEGVTERAQADGAPHEDGGGGAAEVPAVRARQIQVLRYGGGAAAQALVVPRLIVPLQDGGRAAAQVLAMLPRLIAHSVRSRWRQRHAEDNKGCEWSVWARQFTACAVGDAGTDTDA